MTKTGTSTTAGLGATVRAHPVLAVFTIGYLVGFTVLGLVLGSPLAVPYLGVVATLVLLVIQLDRRFGLGAPLLWALAGWGLAHMAGGVVPAGEGRTLYNLWIVDGWLRYDQAVHAFGFGTATLVCGTVLGRWLPAAGPRPGPAVLALLAGMGVGAINEVVEFAATLVLADTNVGGYRNTGWDLVFDLLGAVVAATWLATRSFYGPARRCTDTAYSPLPGQGWRSQVAHRCTSTRPAAEHMAS